MVRGINLLTDTQVRKSKLPKGKKVLYLTDGGGLKLHIRYDNGKAWIYRYTFPPKTPEKVLGLGSYPEVSLVEARKRRDLCNQLKANGTHPKEWSQGIKKSIDDYDPKFLVSTIYEKYIEEQKDKWSVKSLVRMQGIWKNYLEKGLKGKSVTTLTEDELVAIFKSIKTNPVALVSGKTDIKKYDRSVTTKYAKTLMNQIYLHAREWCGFKGTNPMPNIAKHSVFKQNKVKSHKAVSTDDLGKYWHLVKNLEMLQDRIYMQVDIITALRVGSLAQAKWSMFNPSKKLLSLPKELMKTDIDFATPIPTLLVDELKELKKMTNGKPDDYIFTNRFGKHYSTDRPRILVKSMGFEDATAHGNRTILKINASRFSNVSSFAIDYQLSHEVASKDKVERAYLGDYDWLDERRQLVDWFIKYLDGLEKVYVDSQKALNKVRTGSGTTRTVKES